VFVHAVGAIRSSWDTYSTSEESTTTSWKQANGQQEQQEIHICIYVFGKMSMIRNRNIVHKPTQHGAAPPAPLFHVGRWRAQRWAGRRGGAKF
jgi:hypothetical protein